MNSNHKADAAWDDYVSQQQEQKIEELERELNAANDRIKRLEEAGDILSRYLRDIPYASDYLYQSGERSLRINNWTQAKEAKL